jgi:hypothetical protein
LRIGEVTLHGELSTIDRAALLLAEVQVLGALCDRAGTSEQRAELGQILDQYSFLEPEHQVVFESIRSLLPRDRISPARLAVHLNNRGFPDVDLEKYRAAAPADIEDALKLASRLCRSDHKSDVGVRYDGKREVKHET